MGFLAEEGEDEGGESAEGGGDFAFAESGGFGEGGDVVGELGAEEFGETAFARAHEVGAVFGENGVGVGEDFAVDFGEELGDEGGLGGVLGGFFEDGKEGGKGLGDELREDGGVDAEVAGETAEGFGAELGFGVC